MKKTIYNNFYAEIKRDLIEFLFKYNIAFNCKFPLNESDDFQYTINLGDKFGNVNILFESFENIPKNEKDSDTFIIPIRFCNYNETFKNVFKFDCGEINEQDGTLILFSKINGLESLRDTFTKILNIWSKEQKEKIFDRPTPICLN